MGAVLSVQLGSAVATHLFHAVGPGGAAFLRLAFGSLVLVTVSRPDLRGSAWTDLATAVLFGLTVAGMNFTFYSAIDRIPLGVAVALEFTGPLTVAVLGSRRALDVVWVLLAAAGVVLLTPWGGLALDPVGVVLALITAIFWGSYILLSARVGRIFPGGSGLSVALTAGALALAPFGLAAAPQHLIDLRVLALGAGVGVLSSVIPYSLELEALRRIPTRIFGVLMSTEPAVGALVGYVFLRQVLGARAIAAIALVSVAATAAALLGHDDTVAHEAAP
jgi:inner membrane transporter RhtA